MNSFVTKIRNFCRYATQFQSNAATANVINKPTYFYVPTDIEDYKTRKRSPNFNFVDQYHQFPLTNTSCVFQQYSKSIWNRLKNLTGTTPQAVTGIISRPKCDLTMSSKIIRQIQNDEWYSKCITRNLAGDTVILTQSKKYNITYQCKREYAKKSCLKSKKRKRKACEKKKSCNFPPFGKPSSLNKNIPKSKSTQEAKCKKSKTFKFSKRAKSDSSVQKNKKSCPSQALKSTQNRCSECRSKNAPAFAEPSDMNVHVRKTKKKTCDEVVKSKAKPNSLCQQKPKRQVPKEKPKRQVSKEKPKRQVCKQKPKRQVRKRKPKRPVRKLKPKRKLKCKPKYPKKKTAKKSRKPKCPKPPKGNPCGHPKQW